MSEIKFEVAVLAEQGIIQSNIESIKKEVAALAAQYEGVVFTDDSKAAAKKTVADLRKTRKGIEDSRKAVKKQWMVPYERFEGSVRGLLTIIDKPIEQINGQVDAFEQERLEEREADIESIYMEEIGDLADFLPLYKIRDDKWNNASVTTKTIRKNMTESIATARAGKAVLENMQSDAAPDALQKFRATLDLADSLAYINQYEAQRAEVLKREEERRRQDDERQRVVEIERVRQEERQRIAEEERIRREAEQATMEQVRAVDEVAAAPLVPTDSHTEVWTIRGNDEEFGQLKMFMESIGIYYERKDV